MRKYQEHRDATKKVIAEILHPDQVKRFNEIVLQKRGANALDDPDIADKLDLTATQREKIVSLQNESRFPFQPRGPGRGARAFRNARRAIYGSADSCSARQMEGNGRRTVRRHRRRAVRRILPWPWHARRILR